VSKYLTNSIAWHEGLKKNITANCMVQVLTMASCNLGKCTCHYTNEVVLI